jgi:glycosyltransferase involved in cell wall biosynthesis
MEILIAASYMPVSQGRQAGTKTSYYLCEYLARKHRLHLLAFSTKDGLAGFSKEDMSLFVSWKSIPVTNRDRIWGAMTAPGLPLAVAVRNSQTYRREFHKLLIEHRFDVVLLDHTAMFQYAAEVPASIVVGGNAHDIVMQYWSRRAAAAKNKLFRYLLGAEAKRIRDWEQQVFGELNFILIPSEKDKDLLLKLQPRATAIVIDPWVSATAGGDVTGRQAGSLLFYGAMNRSENVDAARWGAREIFPQIKQAVQETKLYIAGSQSEKLGNEFSERDGIFVTGFVPDMAKLMAGMEIAFLPLRHGAGIKVKVLECMTAGLPVVTTSVGAEGVGGVDGVHYLVGESAEELATLVLRLLRNPIEAQKMGECAKQFMQQRYNFEGGIAKVECYMEEQVSKLKS